MLVCVSPHRVLGIHVFFSVSRVGNCSYLIVWLVGEFDCSLYWYLRLREVYFVPSGAVRNWKDFKHNALGPFGHLHFANSMLWRRLSSTPRRSVCNIDCGRRKGMWKYPYPVDAIHNTMSKRSLGFYTLLSMVECILSTWGCGCANEAHHEKSYCGMYSFLRMVDFQLDWSGLATATFLTERLAAEWCIRIGIWCENQTLGLNAIAYLWHFTPSSRSVMTWYHIMELGAPLAEHWLFVDSDRGDWPYCCNWLVPSIICERWPWTPTLLWLEQLVWIAYFSCLAFLHYVVVWWFQRYIPHWCYWRPVM